MSDIGLIELLCLIAGVFALYYGYSKLTAPPQSSSNSKSKLKSPPASSSLSPSSSSSSPLLPMTILFGSQSSTAETFSGELCEEAKMYGYNAKVVDLQEFDRDEMSSERYLVFLVATFGEGEPTDNAMEFMEWIKSSDRTPEETVQGVPFAVFALGNRQYEHYCAVGRQLDARLGELGGERVLERGEGDDDGSLEEDFSSWKKDFWAASHARFGTKALDEQVGAGEKKLFESSFLIQYQSEEEEKKYTGGLKTLLTDQKHRVFKAPVSVVRELRQSTENSSVSTKHIEFDLTGLKMNYITADNLGVYPRNDPQETEEIIKRLGFRGDSVFKTRSKPKKAKKIPFPTYCSIRDAFLWYLDFNYSPRIPQLTILAQHTKDENEKKKLLSYAHEKKEEYVADHKSLKELLEEFPSCSPPLEDLIDFVPKLAPRYYTISSSSVVNPTTVSITVALLVHQKPRGRKSLGICSRYLCSLQSGKDLSAIFVRESSFRFPKPRKVIASATVTENGSSSSLTPSSSSVPPIIMVGPGTGIAPFRGFIQELGHLKEKNLPIGECTLYFGCRDSEKDYLYKEELSLAKSNSSLNDLQVAFSRMEGRPKTYVQDLMKQQGMEVWQRLYTGKGYIFICGGTAMGRSVRECIIKLAVEHGKMTDKEAEEYIKKMQAEKRFVQELWS